MGEAMGRIRIIKITAMIVFIVATLPNPATAEDDSRLDATGDMMHTKELCEICTPLTAEWERTKDPKGEGQGQALILCHSFISGVLSYDGALVGTGERDPDICAPPGFVVRDAKRVFLKYCQTHPEAAAYDASSSVMAALQAVYPCKTAPAAPPHEMTLAELKEFCAAPDKASANVCGFFILGIVEGINIAQDVAKAKQDLCIGEASTSAMLFAVKKNIGEDLMFFPADKDMPAVSFVTGALRTVFPCHSSNAAPAH
jgi:hypothetical protein